MTSEARRTRQRSRSGPSGPLPLPEPELVDTRHGIRMRPWRSDPDDVAALVAAWCDPDLVAANGAPTDASEMRARHWIAGDAERRARYLSLDLVISPLADDGPVSVWGEVGLRGFDLVARRAEVGWWSAPEARGRGVAVAAVDLLVSWALGAPLGLRQVWARIDPTNHASARLAAAAGFRLLGTAGGRAVWSRAS